MRNDLILWNSLYPLTENEKSVLDFKLCHDFNIIDKINYVLPTETSIEHWNSLVSEYFDRMPNCNCTINNAHLSFDISATTFINKLFDDYVDENTLVISTDAEHPNVKIRLKECKNLVELSLDDILSYNFNFIENIVKKYKKVFVYIIGTRNSTGEITPQKFLIDLKNILLKNNVTFKFILDDVQGMFLIPRDYSIFDYVIGTAHAICDGFDMGILISKKQQYGKKAYNWGNEYLKRLDIMLKRKEKMFVFKQFCIQHFNEYITDKNILISDIHAPYIFYLKTNNLYVSTELAHELNKYNLLISDVTFKCNSFIQLRCHKFIKDNTLLTGVLKILDYILFNKDFNEKDVYHILEDF